MPWELIINESLLRFHNLSTHNLRLSCDCTLPLSSARAPLVLLSVVSPFTTQQGALLLSAVHVTRACLEVMCCALRSLFVGFSFSCSAACSAVVRCTDSEL